MGESAGLDEGWEALIHRYRLEEAVDMLIQGLSNP